jgi:membrane protease YdiL (CAAX protease family)
LSSPTNPGFDSGPIDSDLSPVLTDSGGTVAPMPVEPEPPVENPPWSGWEVLALAMVTIVASLFFIWLGGRIFYPSLPAVEVAKRPALSVLSQMVAYLCVVFCMYVLATRTPGRDFLEAIRWNWPRRWAGYLLGGIFLSVALQVFARLLPVPKQLPMDEFFQTRGLAMLMSVFGITVAPLMEELFFRGFLYPVLFRRWGGAIAVLLTALAFALLHSLQLGFAWGPLLVIFLVGIALTLVRAATKSVASGFVVHMAYNATIFVLLFIGTDGFRHMDKLSH